MRQVLCWLLLAYQLVVLVYIVDRIVASPPMALQPVLRFTRRLVDPLVLPLRRRVPRMQVGAVALDSSLWIVIIGLAILRAVIC